MEGAAAGPYGFDTMAGADAKEKARSAALQDGKEMVALRAGSRRR